MESFEDSKSKGSAPTSTNSEDAPDLKFDINCDEAWTFLVETSDTSPGPGQVFLVAEDKKFSVHEHILIEHSNYFERSLRNWRYVESSTKTFIFDDIKAIHLGVYLHLAYCQALGHLSEVPSFGEPECCIWFPGHFKVYQICDRFLNKNLADKVAKDLCEHLVLDTSDWHDGYLSDENKTFLSFYINSLAQCFELCDPADDLQRSLRQIIVKSFCNWAPPASSQRCLELIQGHHDLVFEVASRYAGMLAEATKGKRPRKSVMLQL
ncbi:hypothetical protein N0V92_009314 [Colletotrichum tropicale]|nr:hypothetical protein N0V92_009314 [Colletotrichum tropicale]